jgi:hypothetical protein
LLSFIAACQCKLSVSPEFAFDRLADHGSWTGWMPRSFRPVGGPAGPLRVGDRLRVRIAGLPLASTIVVRVVRRPAEIMWSGGLSGAFYAEHHFHFDPEDGGVRVRSEETWSGVLAPALRRLVQPLAVQIGEQQLIGLARAVSGAPAPPP